MMAKQILLDMCETVVNNHQTRTTKTIEGIRVSLHMHEYTKGIWTLDIPGEPVYCTHDIKQFEIVLGRALSQKTKAGAA
jgi:hypothetical protein